MALANSAMDFHDDITVGRDLTPDCQRAGIETPRLDVLTLVSVDVAQEFKRQSLFTRRLYLLSLIVGCVKVATRGLEITGQPVDVAESDIGKTLAMNPPAGFTQAMRKTEVFQRLRVISKLVVGHTDVEVNHGPFTIQFEILIIGQRTVEPFQCFGILGKPTVNYP